MLNRFAVPVFALILSSPAFAEGFYFGGGATLTQIEEDEAGLRFDDTSFGWRLLGGYTITDHIALEASYFDAGDAEDSILGTDVEIGFDGFILSGLAVLPLNDAWALFGKVGYYDADTEVRAFGDSDRDSESGLTLGAGARFDFNENLGVRGDFDWFDTEADTVWAVGVTLQYSFNL